MLTFKNEDGAGSRGEGEAVVPTENEERRHSSEEEEIAESSADEKVPSSIGEDQATELEEKAREIGIDLAALQKVVGLDTSRKDIWNEKFNQGFVLAPLPGSEPKRDDSTRPPARLPFKLTPAQKQKIDQFEKRLVDNLLPAIMNTSADRHLSAVSTNRKSLGPRGGSTAKHTLTRFEERPPDRDVEAEVQQAQKSIERCEENLDYIDSLRRPKWDFRGRTKSEKPSLTSKPPVQPAQPTLPSETLKRLQSVAHHAFPKRMDLPVLVCDIRAKDAVVYRGQLKDIESAWKTKPTDVIVRWIHAPLGNGIVHSSIEDMFRHDQPPGRSFHYAGPPGFPFLDLDSLQFRATEELEYMRSIHEALHSNQELKVELNESCVADSQNESFIDDFDWRLRHLGKEKDFWQSVLSDIPTELSETFSSGGGEGPIRPRTLGKGPLDPSVLGRQDEQFEGTHLTWAPFRCFHRKDGVLLTMSAATGIDLLHRDFRRHISQPMSFRMKDPDGTVIGSQMKALETRGVEGWYQLTVEYFLVHLVTEIGVTPHNHLSGHSASSLISALKGINRDLKIRRYQHQQWVPGQTSKLVQDYNVFQDELRALSNLFKRRVKFFKHLAKDVEAHAEEDKKSDRDRQLHNEDGEKPAARVEWAIKFNKQQIEQIDALLEDTKCSVDPFFRLSTIQQNDLAITNDRRNKAILVFTAVTVIFLPLSFFSSYWGTNFADIRDTLRTQHYFWKIGGSLTAAIVVLLGVIAFWSQVWFVILTVVRSTFRKRRGYFDEKQPEHKV